MYVHNNLLYIIIKSCYYQCVSVLQVNSVAWNDMGTRLISGSDDCHLNIYDTATGLVSGGISFVAMMRLIFSVFILSLLLIACIKCSDFEQVKFSVY